MSIQLNPQSQTSCNSSQPLIQIYMMAPSPSPVPTMVSSSIVESPSQNDVETIRKEIIDDVLKVLRREIGDLISLTLSDIANEVRDSKKQ